MVYLKAYLELDKKMTLPPTRGAGKLNIPFGNFSCYRWPCDLVLAYKTGENFCGRGGKPSSLIKRRETFYEKNALMHLSLFVLDAL